LAKTIEKSKRISFRELKGLGVKTVRGVAPARPALAQTKITPRNDSKP